MNFSGQTSTAVVHGTSTILGQTPYTYPCTVTNGVCTNADVNYAARGSGELVSETGANNVTNYYWHYIIGDPAAGFAEEVYIQANGQGSTFDTATGLCSPTSMCSASFGVAGPAAVNVLAPNSTTNTGDGTANPNRVLVRMVLGGTWDAGTSTWTCDTSFCSEFIKGAYADKPKITQGINDPDFSSSFILDLSGIALSNNSTDLTLTDKNTAPTGASLTNVQSVIDTTTGSIISSFDMAHDSQTTFVTGGKYTYTPRTGGFNSPLGSNSSYVYVDGGYDPRTIDYAPYLDETVDNPWSYPTAKP